MSCGAQIPLTICKGKTFSKKLGYGQPKLAWKTITNVTVTAPCTLEVIGHGLIDNWMFRVSSIKGTIQLNSPEDDISVYYAATVLDDDNIEISSLNALGFTPYISGGVIYYNLPVDLSIYTKAEMQIRKKIASEEILESLTLATGEISLEDFGWINLTLPKSRTAAIDWKKGVYDIELTTASDVVDSPAYGSIEIEEEVTR